MTTYCVLLEYGALHHISHVPSVKLGHVVETISFHNDVAYFQSVRVQVRQVSHRLRLNIHKKGVKSRNKQRLRETETQRVTKTQLSICATHQIASWDPVIKGSNRHSFCEHFVSHVLE